MKTAGSVLLVAALFAGVAYLSTCPCERVPGAWLIGDEQAGEVTDWSFVNDRTEVPLCQLEITTWRPHSINLNCMSADNTLFVSCSRCAGKQWSNDALTHPNARIRAGNSIYPVTVTRVTSNAELNQAWQARARKTASKAAPRPDHWWSFKLASRSD